MSEPVDRDVLRAAVPFVAAALAVVAGVTDPPSRPVGVVLLVVAVAAFAAWAWLPGFPTPVLVGGVLVPVVLAKGPGELDTGLFLLSLLAIVVAGWEPARAWVIGLGAVTAAAPLAVELRVPGDVDVAVWMVGIAFPGVLSWVFRRQEELRTELAAARVELAERAAAQDRARVARDVHDLVGHGLAAVLLQVASARHVLRRDPDDADDALRAAEEAGRRSLSELRATVAGLRADGESAASAVPGLAQLPRLVDEVRAGGLDVTAHATGDAATVDPSTGLALYRVAQEALRNAARHAPDATTTVTTVIDDVHAELCVRSDGPLRVGVRPGYGLVGMRERADAVGGQLSAGPDADGWLVRCVVPVRVP